MKRLILLLIFSQKMFGQALTEQPINGVFIVNQIKYSDPSCSINQLKTSNAVAAYFTYTPTAIIDLNALCKAGNVKFNNKPLGYDNDKNFYGLVDIDNISQKEWKVSGHKEIPNMNFIYSGNLPNFALDQSLILDTLKRSDTLFMQINDIQNADSLVITVTDDNQQSSPHSVILTSTANLNSLYIPSATLSGLSLGPRAELKVEVMKHNYQTIEGKNYLFIDTTTLIKENMIIQ